MVMELYKRRRPKTLKGIIGQEAAKTSVRNWFEKNKVPHAILISGPTGTGKTTLARIIASKLKCFGQDLSEKNCADFRGIDSIRDIRSQAGYAAFHSDSDCRIWIIDEVHQMTTAAQTAFLKLLEDPPPKVYFILCTTHPETLNTAMLNRLSKLSLTNLTTAQMNLLLKKVTKKEKFALEEEVHEAIVEAAEGSPRQALVFLDTVLSLDTMEEQLNSIMSPDAKKAADNLGVLLLFKPLPTWSTIATALREVDEDPERIRRMILGMASNTMRKAGKNTARANLVIECFSEPFFNTGKAGLDSACYEVISTLKNK